MAGSSKWLFGILLPLHKTLSVILIGVLVVLRTTVLTLTWLNSTVEGRNQ